ncbi:MAG TPA: CoA protein activase [Clostridiales bacterium]|nr:CoA protein activase [Clostridiales bacterium]
MKITFPHMGNTYIAAKAFFEGLGMDVVIPKPCNKSTLEIGTKCSPESACLPLKVNLGNYLDCIERGADTVILSGSCGPCRFGYYGIVQKEILKDMGYDIDFIIIDPLQDSLKRFLQPIKKLFTGHSLAKIYKVGRAAFQVVKEIDELEYMTFKIRPREKRKYETDTVYADFKREVLKVTGPYEILDVIRKYKQKLLSIDIHRGLNPLKIGIVGEIYTIIEPYVNLNVEQKLGNMGVEVDRSLSISRWIDDNVTRRFFRPGHRENEVERAAKPYIPLCVGGHGRECVGHTLLYSRKGYDGIIQILPFGCMPEIVAESVLPTIRKDTGIPIMTLVVDELTGETGYNTRLEAFVDMILRKKERSKSKCTVDI